MKKAVLISVLTALSLLVLSGCDIGKKSGGSSATGADGSAIVDIEDPSLKTEDSPALKITEIMVQNRLTAADSSGNFTPWLEIQNISGAPAALSGYRLMNKDGSWTLPDITLESGAYYVVFANGSDCPLTLESSGMLTLFHGDLLTDRVSYANPTADRSYLVGSGTESYLPTPGYSEPRERDLLMISEVMSKNTLYPVGGSLCGYIELYNYGNSDIDLHNCYLTNDQTLTYRFRLPEKILKPGEYFLLDSQRDLGFTPDQKGGTLLVTRNDGVLCSYITYPELKKNQVFTGEQTLSELPSPGFANTEAGYAAYIASRKGLLINEVITSNSKYNKTDGDYYDMVELVNNSGAPVMLSDYYLSDSSKDMKKYRLPEITLGDGEMYTVIASGKGGGHAPFKLSQDGEKLFVSKEDGYVVDAVDIPYLPVNVSYGRYNGSFVYLATPSFGLSNPFGYPDMSPDPIASTGSGFYKGNLSITLSGGGTIYYTTDGTTPTKTSKRYNGEHISVKTSTTIRAICYDGDKIPSRDVCFNYFINTPDLTLPIVKVSVEHESMYGENGIFTNYSSKKEVPAHVAMYVDGNEEFSVNCGLKVFGAFSRRYQKKSYQLKFRSKYGVSKLKYDIFGDGEITEFNSLVLRSGSQDYYRAMMRDEFATALASDFGGLLVQKYRPVSVFINDEYVGVYYIREKINDDFISSHTGVSPESVTIVNLGKNSLQTGTDLADWKDIWNFAKNKDLSVEENYNHICEHIDIDDLVNYYIFLIWSDNRDSGNVRVYKSSEGDGKWRFIFFDTDLGLGAYESPSKPSVRYFLETYVSSEAPYNVLIFKLMKNAGFKDKFLTKLGEFASTAFKNEEVLSRLDALEALIDNDISLSPRLANEYLNPPTYNTWKTSWVVKLKKYVTDRGQLLCDHIASLYKLSNEEKEKYFGSN